MKKTFGQLKDCIKKICENYPELHEFKAEIDEINKADKLNDIIVKILGVHTGNINEISRQLHECNNDYTESNQYKK
jgi:hypothetical protein